jgi:hypothetical protein
MKHVPGTNIPVLGYKISRDDWEKGRATRRAISRAAVDKAPLRRTEGDPRKDAILRSLNNGERGMPFTDLQPGHE